MTTLETRPEQLETYNPYGISFDAFETQFLVDQVLSSVTPYADSSTNPDLGTKKIFMIDGYGFGSDLGRIIEGNVLNDDEHWGQSPEQTSKELSAVEDNSRFFILIDDKEDGAELVGSIRIADCDKGLSETVGFYNDSFANQSLPQELSVGERDGVWDVVYVVVRPEYQNGMDSAWLYYAMHKNSVEEDKKEWISNISDAEYKRLKMIGIPFKPIPETSKVSVRSNKNPNIVQDFGFYHTMLEDVADSVDSTAEKYEQRGGAAGIIGKIALISRFGTQTRPETLKLIA